MSVLKLPAGYRAPVLRERPRFNKWYRVPLKEGITGDGCPYHFYISKGHLRNLIIFFAGGGVAWDSFSAAHPTDAKGVLTGDPGFYWANLRPFTEFMNINQGITENHNILNHFHDWNIAVITYATGDFHLGKSEFRYDENDPEKVMHFNGYRNFSLALDIIKHYFPEPENLLIAGDSAGGFATAALSDTVLKRYDPERTKVSVCSDSALLPWNGWKRTMRVLWDTEPEICDRIKSDNPVTDWFYDLYGKYGDKINYLFTCSCRDEVLTAYWNALKGKDYGSDEEIRKGFHEALKQMVFDMMDITGKFCFYINDFRLIPEAEIHIPVKNIPLKLWDSGTVHTCIRNPLFYSGKMDGVNMHDWLWDMIRGEHYSAGMGLLST